jgi:hypothetical protein
MLRVLGRPEKTVTEGCTRGFAPEFELEEGAEDLRDVVCVFSWFSVRFLAAGLGLQQQHCLMASVSASFTMVVWQQHVPFGPQVVFSSRSVDDCEAPVSGRSLISSCAFGFCSSFSFSDETVDTRYSTIERLGS